MRIVERPSPNHDARPDGAAIDILVLHYTGMRTAEEALTRLCDPVARVSAHYTIDTDGRIYRHVPEERRAWHAGVSFWAGERNVNARSIGIELVNPGHEFGYVPFADAQIGALIDLSSGIFARHAVVPHRVVGHSDVAPPRKTDPGELFPWKELAQYAIGIWPGASPPAGEAPFARVAEMLSQFGYGVPPAVDWSLQSVIAAFQRRFRPEKIDGVADPETVARLAALVTHGTHAVT
jgi:N-acetylmuramoyl-L-alanine amidase